MRLDQFIMSAAIFSFFVMGSLILVADINLNYGLTMDTSAFNNTYSVMNETFNLTDNMRDRTLDNPIGTGLTMEDSLFRGGYSTIRLTRSMFGIVGTMINDFARVLGLHPIVITFTITIMTIFITWMIVYLIMRFIPK